VANSVFGCLEIDLGAARNRLIAFDDADNEGTSGYDVVTAYPGGTFCPYSDLADGHTWKYIGFDPIYINCETIERAKLVQPMLCDCFDVLSQLDQSLPLV